MKTESFHILAAEDDPGISLIVGTILRRLGHTVDIAADGKEAISLYSQKPDAYHILITDHSMPNVSGLDLVSYVRKNGFAGKIIVMSGSLDEALTRAYLAKHVDKILQKPFTLEMLSVTLTELLEDWNGGEANP